MANANSPFGFQSKQWEFKPELPKEDKTLSNTNLKEGVKDPDLVRIRQLIKDRIDLLHRKVQMQRQEQFVASLPAPSRTDKVKHNVRQPQVPEMSIPVGAVSALSSSSILPSDELTRNQLLKLVSERLQLNRLLHSLSQRSCSLNPSLIGQDCSPFPMKASVGTTRQSITVCHHVHQDSDASIEQLNSPPRKPLNLTFQNLPPIDIHESETEFGIPSPAKNFVSHAQVQANLPPSFTITQPEDLLEVIAEVLQEEMKKVLQVTPSLRETDDDDNNDMIHRYETQAVETETKEEADVEDAQMEEDAGIDFLTLMHRLQANTSTQTELSNQRDHGTSPAPPQVENRHTETWIDVQERSCQYSPTGNNDPSAAIYSQAGHVLDEDKEDGLGSPRQGLPLPSLYPSMPSCNFHDLPSPVSLSPPICVSFADHSVQIGIELPHEPFTCEDATLISSASASDIPSVSEQDMGYSEGEVKRVMSPGELSPNRSYSLSEGEIFLPGCFAAKAHYSVISEGEISEGLAEIPKLQQDLK